MANLPNFSFTRNAPVFDESRLLPGTSIHVEGGNRSDKTFFEGNGIISSVSTSSIDVNLFELHTLEFQELNITVEDFMNEVVKVQLLTIEDGTGTEETGAIPSDVTPPGEVEDLTTVATDNSITLTFTLPTDEDFSHLMIYQDDVLIAANVIASPYVVSNLLDATEYEFLIKTVDVLGNISEGTTMSVTTEEDITSDEETL